MKRQWIFVCLALLGLAMATISGSTNTTHPATAFFSEDTNALNADSNAPVLDPDSVAGDSNADSARDTNDSAGTPDQNTVTPADSDAKKTDQNAENPLVTKIDFALTKFLFNETDANFGLFRIDSHNEYRFHFDFIRTTPATAEVDGLLVVTAPLWVDFEDLNTGTSEFAAPYLDINHDWVPIGACPTLPMPTAPRLTGCDLRESVSSNGQESVSIDLRIRSTADFLMRFNAVKFQMYLSEDANAPVLIDVPDQNYVLTLDENAGVYTTDEFGNRVVTQEVNTDSNAGTDNLTDLDSDSSAPEKVTAVVPDQTRGLEPEDYSFETDPQTGTARLRAKSVVLTIERETVVCANDTCRTPLRLENRSDTTLCFSQNDVRIDSDQMNDPQLLTTLTETWKIPIVEPIRVTRLCVENTIEGDQCTVRAVVRATGQPKAQRVTCESIDDAGTCTLVVQKKTGETLVQKEILDAMPEVLCVAPASAQDFTLRTTVTTPSRGKYTLWFKTFQAHARWISVLDQNTTVTVRPSTVPALLTLIDSDQNVALDAAATGEVKTGVYTATIAFSDTPLVSRILLQNAELEQDGPLVETGAVDKNSLRIPFQYQMLGALRIHATTTISAGVVFLKAPKGAVRLLQCAAISDENGECDAPWIEHDLFADPTPRLTFDAQTILVFAKSRRLLKSRLRLLPGKTSFSADENAVFEWNVVDSDGDALTPDLDIELDGPGEKQAIPREWITRVGVLESNLKVYGEKQAIPREWITRDGNAFRLKIVRPRDFRPGQYTLRIRSDPRQTLLDDEISFPWGLVSLNTTKSTYYPGETARFIVVVLDGNGRSVCDADIRMTIATPAKKTDRLSTQDQTITPNTECGLYDGNYRLGPIGTYRVRVMATANGIDSSFETDFRVSHSIPFEIIRTAKSKIDPTQSNHFDVSVDIVSHTTATRIGIVETVPARFDVTTDGIQNETQDAKTIRFDAPLIDGKTRITYAYSVPMEWPRLYTLGPIQVQSDDQNYDEARPWYVAVDPAPNSCGDTNNVCIIDSNISTDTNWVDGNTYVLMTDINVTGSGTDLNIAPGAVIKPVLYAKLVVRDSGRIIANGTADKNIIFTSCRDQNIYAGSTNANTSTIPGCSGAPYSQDYNNAIYIQSTANMGYSDTISYVKIFDANIGIKLDLNIGSVHDSNFWYLNQTTSSVTNRGAILLGRSNDTNFYNNVFNQAQGTNGKGIVAVSSYRGAIYNNDFNGLAGTAYGVYLGSNFDGSFYNNNCKLIAQTGYCLLANSAVNNSTVHDNNFTQMLGTGIDYRTFTQGAIYNNRWNSTGASLANFLLIDAGTSAGNIYNNDFNGARFGMYLQTTFTGQIYNNTCKGPLTDCIRINANFSGSIHDNNFIDIKPFTSTRAIGIDFVGASKTFSGTVYNNRFRGFRGPTQTTMPSWGIFVSGAGASWTGSVYNNTFASGDGNMSGIGNSASFTGTVQRNIFSDLNRALV
ncbi:MAG: right-handed parallel beta-helix repeat-containing protein, partial [Candidatus Diapherotrites archaeon]|nr:right-handed parallel beta-helix repeat-containing protein [Candidatus Diapherotrites archaeon]